MMGGDRTRTHLAAKPQEIFSFLYQLIMHHLCFGVSPQTAMAVEWRRKEKEHGVSVFYAFIRVNRREALFQTPYLTTLKTSLIFYLT